MKVTVVGAAGRGPPQLRRQVAAASATSTCATASATPTCGPTRGPAQTLLLRSQVLSWTRRLARGPGLRRGRDPGLPPHPRRRPGPAVRHPPQRPRHRPVPADRPGAVPQAAGRRRIREGLRDRPGVPQRGPVAPAQPRVHDARAVPGLRRLHRHDGPDRGPGLGAGRGPARDHLADVRRPSARRWPRRGGGRP